MVKKLSSLQILLLVGLIVAALSMVGKYPPEFFDNFGLIIFVFITGLGYWMFTTKKEAPDIIAYILLLVGLLGVVIDGYIVLFS